MAAWKWRGRRGGAILWGVLRAGGVGAEAVSVPCTYVEGAGVTGDVSPFSGRKVIGKVGLLLVCWQAVLQGVACCAR